MVTRANVLPVLLAVCVVLGGCPEAPAPEVPAPEAPEPEASPEPERPARHEVKLHRPSKLGTRFRLTTTLTASKVETSSGGEGSALPSRSSRVVELEAKVKVVAVDARGSIKGAEYEVDRFVVTVSGGAPVTILPQGTVLTAARGDPPTLEVDRGEITDESRSYIEDVLDLTPSRGVVDDDIFGTTKAQKVGGTWPVSAPAVAAALSEEDATLLSDGITGEATFEELAERGGEECLSIGAKIAATKITFAKMPPFLTIDQGRFDIELSGLYPTDPRKLVPLERSKMTGRLKITAKVVGSTITEELLTEQLLVVERAPLKGRLADLISKSLPDAGAAHGGDGS